MTNERSAIESLLQKLQISTFIFSSSFLWFLGNINPKNRNIECEENIIEINNLQVYNDNLKEKF